MHVCIDIFLLEKCFEVLFTVRYFDGVFIALALKSVDYATIVTASSRPFQNRNIEHAMVANIKAIKLNI